MDGVSLTGRILLADDDEAIRTAYAKVLQAAGHEVHVAEDGKVAATLAEQPFDAIVTDIWMPGMSGTDLLRRVRAYDRDVPIILVTGSPELESAVTAVEHRAFMYLRKPVRLKELVDVVQRALQMHLQTKRAHGAMALAGAAEKSREELTQLGARLDSALAQLWMARQAIVRFSNKTVFAFECLMRSDDAGMPHPMAILNAAERLKRVSDLSRKVRERCAAHFAEADVETLLVNLHPEDLLDDELFSPSAPLSKVASRVVLEITERAAIDTIKDLRARVDRLRAMGFRIAVDDLGSGYSGLNSFAQLEPEFVKLDMALVRDVDRKPTQRRLIESVVSACRDMKVQVIAEGIETLAERDTLVEIGCDLMQGYYFAKPARTVGPVHW